MKIFLIRLDDGHCIFYSEGPEVIIDNEPITHRRGIRGWVERKYKSLQVILNESEKGVGLRMRRIWQWLQKRIPPDEPILRSLRGTTAITLYYPPVLAPEESMATWNAYLKERQGRHMFWFIANALVSPLTLLLAPLPGPNIIGYWFVYRAVCHLLARLGARHARSERVETALVATSALDVPIATIDAEWMSTLSATFGLIGLESYIMRMARNNKSSRRKAVIAA